MFLLDFTYSIAKPIFISFFIYLLIEPFASWLHKKVVKKSIASSISVIVLILLLAAFFGLTGAAIISEFIYFIKLTPDYIWGIQDTFSKEIVSLQQEISLFPPDIAANIRTFSADFAKSMAI